MNEDDARKYFELLRWPNGPICPACGVIPNAYRLLPTLSKKDTHVRDGVWKCRDCRKQFTVTVGTIFEDSHIPLNKWVLAYQLLNKGINAHQLHKILQITYRSARFMIDRLHTGLFNDKPE